MVSSGLWGRLFKPLKSVRVAGLAVLATVLPFWFSSCATKRNHMVKGKMQSVTDTSRSNGKGIMLLGVTVSRPAAGQHMMIGKPEAPKREH